MLCTSIYKLTERLLCFCCLLLYFNSNAQVSHAIPSNNFIKKFSTNNKTGKTGDMFGMQQAFIENTGQYGKTIAECADMGDIKFAYHGFNMPVLFTPNGIIYLQKKSLSQSENAKEKLAGNRDVEQDNDLQKFTTGFISMQWLNANKNVQLIASDETPSYFTFGMNTRKARGFKKLVYKELYKGVDVTYYFNNDIKKNGFEYSITVKPGADLSAIKLKVGGQVKNINALTDGSIIYKNDIGGFTESFPKSFYEDDRSNVAIAFRAEKNIISFLSKSNYNKNKTLVIDPFVSSTSNLDGLNAGKAKDVDYDYAGNVYVAGGGDGASNYRLAKYDANGILQWTFSGALTNPSWQFGTYYGGWVVDKPSGNIYLGQGFEPNFGFTVIRLSTIGIYDNYITTANANFREDWKMYWNCNSGTPQLFIAGGGTNSNINFGIVTPPSTTISSLNVTGIPYSTSTGWAQDISDFVFDPVSGDMYSIYGSLYGTPSLSNQIYKNTKPYSSASIAWNLYSGFTSIQEIANRPYLSGSDIDNSSNVLAVNSSYFFYWDGKNLKAFNKTTGATVGTPLTIATNTTLMSGGIIADECNDIYVGSTNGTIKTYKFNGSVFDDAALPDISIPGYAGSSVYDLAYNESQKILYASGDGFVAAFDVTSYGCVNTSYNLTVAPDCLTASATVTINPTPPVGSVVTYNLYIGTTLIASNSTGKFTGLKQGVTYTVQAFVNEVCSGSVAVKNFILPGPTLTLTASNTTCGNATGSITATASNGNAPYSFSKDGITYQSSNVFANLAAGLYLISVKDAGGCISTDSIIVKNTNGPTVTATKKDALCGNNNGTITATASGGTAPYQYSIDGVNFQSSNIFNGVAAGNYTVTVKDANGCTNVTTITVISTGGATISAIGTATTCNNTNGIITVIASGGTAPLQYSINGNIYQASNIFNGLAAGTYTAYVKDANGCINSTTVTINNSPGPTVSATTTAATCNNINGTITATGNKGVPPYQYSINAITYQTNNLFTGLAAGSYTVYIKDNNGCINSTTVIISNTNGPNVSATASAAACGLSNGSITVTATGVAPFQYSINGFTFQASNIFSGLATGTYTVYAKDANGCIGTFVITVATVSGPSLTATTTATSCTANTGIITAVATGGTPPLQYSINGITYQASNTFNNLASGNYTVFVKDKNGCIATTQVFIDNADGLKLNATSISTFCSSANGSITATVSGGIAPFQYSIDAITYQAGNIFNNISSGFYTVYTKDKNGCTVSDTVTVNASASVNITATFTNANCNGNNGTIKATASGGTLPYQFSINGITFQTSGSFINLSPNTYTVTVKDANGCTSSTTVTVINVGTGPGPTIKVTNIDQVYCGNPEGGQVQVSASGGTTPYQFSIDGGPFQGGGTFNGVQPGVHTVTVMDANGCSSSIQVTVKDIPAPTLTATSTATPCGLSTGTITATATGGTKPYKFSLNGGPFQTSSTFTGLSAGTYTITVRDNEGCKSSIDVTVLNTGGPSVTTTKKDATCGNNNGSITATGSGGTAPYKYSINGGTYQNSSTFTNLGAGTYTITVKDATGCTGGITVNINDPAGIVATAVSTNATCNSANGTITVTASGGTAPLKYSIDGTTFLSSATFSNLAPGNYTVTVGDAAGCFTKVNIKVNTTAVPLITAFTVDATCSNNDGSITANVTGGTIPFVFSLNSGVFQSSNTFSGLAAGAYTIIVKDGSGCTNTTSVNVSNTSTLAFVATSAKTTCGNSNGSITLTASGGQAPYQYSINGTLYQAANVFTNLTAATYNVYVKDSKGCIASQIIQLQNINGPQQLSTTLQDATCGNKNGSITLTATGGTAPFQYSINGSTYQASNLFSGLAAGGYTVYVKDANGCILTNTVTINNLNAPALSVAVTDASCSKADGIIVVTASGGTGIIQYSVDGITYQSNNVFNNLAANTYTVYVKDKNGCINTSVATVKGGAGPTLTTTAKNETCGSSNGSITATATGGKAPYTYSIDGVTFQASNIFNGLSAKTYTVTVKDANGCINTSTTTVNNIAGPTLTATSKSATCGNSNGSITATATGGTAPYTYSIDGTTFQASNIFNGLAAKTYTVTVKDANGCINTSTTTVNNIAGPTLTATSTNATCGLSNGSITATATSGTAPYTYSIDGTTFLASNIFNGLSAKTYTVTVKDANGCIGTSTTTVNNIAGPTLTAASKNATCGNSNGSITATATGGTAPFAYSIDGVTFQSANVFNNLAAKTYTITIKDANGCIGTTLATVNNTSGPALTTTTTDATCGSSNGNITATATNGTTPYTYSIDGINFQTSNVFNNLAASNYTVTVKDANGCTAIASSTIKSIGAPTLSAVSVNASCGTNNGSITSTATGGAKPYTYSIDGINFQTSNVFNNLAANNYTVTVKDANGCVGTTSIPVNNTGGPTVAATTANATCGNNNGKITAAASSGTAPYSYSIDGTTFQANNVFSNLPVNTYIVTAKDVNGCIATTSAIINNIAGPTLTTNSSSSTCGSNNGTITATATSGTAPYTYSIDGINFQSSNIFNNLSASNYNVIVKDVNGCISTSTITINSIGGPTLSTSATNASCGSNNGTITATASSGTAPYTYSIDGINFQSSNIFSNLSANNYNVIVKDVNGCISTSTITINSIGGPTLSTAVTNASCGSNNGTITATATSGTAPYSYSIDGINFQSSNIFSNLSANNYNVIVKDINGCISTSTITVNSIGGPTLSTSATNASCSSNNGTITATATSGTAPYTYSIDGINFQASNIFSNLSANNYNVIVKDVNGCISTSTITINSIGGPTLATSATDASCGSTNGSITATATSGTAPYSYSIDGINFQSSNIFNNLSANNYNVIVKDVNGCISTSTITINSIGGPTLSTFATNASCGSNNGTITATATSGTAPYSYSINGINFQSSNIFNNLSANNYNVIVKDINGCISTSTITVNSIGGPTLTTSATNASCGSNNGTITATASSGAAPYTFSIDGINFQSSNIFSNLSSGNYTINVKDINGCIASIPTIVNSLNSISANAGNDVTICTGKTTSLNASSDGNTFSWFPETGLSNSSVLNPIASPAATTTYILTASLGTCVQQDSMTVFVTPPPVANAGYDTAVCVGGSVQLDGSNGATYNWSPANFLSNPHIANPIVVNPSISMQYTLSVADANGCPSINTDTVNVTLLPQPKIFAGNDTAIIINQPLQLNAIDLTNSGFTSYTWTPPYALNNPSIQNPVAVLDKDITYTLYAVTKENCKSIDQITIKVYIGPEIYVPTAFTPNKDGFNDKEKAFPVGLKQFLYFSIYNRWGQMVFTTSDPAIGWDGNFNGKPQQSGTFVWQAEGIDYTGKKLYRKGTVVLIR